MVTNPKNNDKMTISKKGSAPIFHVFEAKDMRKIKGRGCADGIKWCKYLTKDNTSAPTVGTEYLFLMCLIDAVDHCKVVKVNMPGAFIQVDM